MFMQCFQCCTTLFRAAIFFSEFAKSEAKILPNPFEHSVPCSSSRPQFSQDRENPEEAPFNPLGLVLMPTLALAKGKTSQRIESTGTRACSAGFPHKNGQWGGGEKWRRFSFDLNRARNLPYRLPFLSLHSTLPYQKYKAVILIIYSQKVREGLH